MPKTYTATVYRDTNGFEYEGQRYNPGDASPQLNACQMKAFVAAYRAANPNGALLASNDDMRTLEEECPATPNTAVPQPAPITSPTESNPAASGGDSAQQQAAPTPPAGAGIQGGPGDEALTAPPSPGQEPIRPPDGEPHPTLGGEQPQDQTDGGDPVDLFHGSLYLQETDLEIPNTIMPLTLTRYYRSGAAAFGPLGWNWDHNHNLFMRELKNGDVALWRDLHEDIFVFDGAKFEPPRGKFEQLERVAGLAQTFELIGVGGMIARFERPVGWIDAERIPIVWLKDRHGNQLSYSYAADDKLSAVTDDDGRFIQFAYDACGLLVSAVDHSGRKFVYEHNAERQQLACVVSPPTSDCPDGITRIYHYEKPFTAPEMRHNILRIEDSDGRVYLENKYEQDPASFSYARITEQLYGNCLYQFRYTQLQWVPPNPIYINLPALRVEVMNPDYSLETYTFNFRGDLLDHRWRLNKDRSFRVVVWQYEFDEQGNLALIIKPDGSREISTFDAANANPRMRGNLLRRELTSAAGFPAPSRIIWTGKYDASFQLLVEEKSETGAITKYKYDFDLTPAALANSGKLKQIIYPDATLPDGTIQNCVAQFENNAKGQITANINAAGTREDLEYGTAGNETSRLIRRRTDPGGLNIENHLSYDKFGYLKECVDGNGNAAKSIHNAFGQLEQQIEPAVDGIETATIYHYDTDRHITATHKPKGAYDGTVDSHIIDINERDVLGYPTKYILSDNTPEARTFKVGNDYRGNPLEIKNPDGSLVLRTIDERGLLVFEEQQGRDGQKVTSRKVYDRTGRLTREINAAGQATDYEYDGFGRLAKVAMPNGSQITNTWGENDLLLSEEIVGDDGQGHARLLRKTAYEYDRKDRKVKEIITSFNDNPAASVDLETQFFYDALDQLVKSLDYRGAEDNSFYDNAGRLFRKRDAEGNEEHYSFDNNDNIIRFDSHHIEPSGATTVYSKQFTYDARNRRIETLEPDGSLSTEVWDDRNLLVERTNLLGVSNEIKYNSFGEKVSEVQDSDGLSVTHQWTMDNMGRMVSYTDPVGQVSTYIYDSLGRLQKTEYPNGSSTRRTFNDKGLVSKEELGSGVVFEFSFDIANRLKTIKNPQSPAAISSIPNHQFGYDGLDRVVSAQSGANQVLRAYDSLGRITAETSNGDVIQCTYDDAGGFVEKAWSDGRTERYAHNLNGTVSTVTQTAGGFFGSGNGLIVNLTPSGPNHLGQAAYPNNFKIETVFDERKRAVELAISNSGATNENVKYRYDGANRRRVEAIIGNNSRISQHNFDNRNRLAKSFHELTTPVPNALTQAENDAAIAIVHGNSGTAVFEEGFAYNDADERLQYSETGSPDKNYIYVNGHRIQNDGVNVYTYYTDGTMSADGTFDYTVDSLGRVIRLEQAGAGVMDIEYDAFGRPSILRESGQPKLSFNYLGNFVEQENHNNVPFRQLTRHPATGVPIAYHVSGTSYYPVFDGRFNLIALADTNGNILETYRYRAFGSPTIFDAAGAALAASAFDIEPIFGGQRYIQSIGLYLSTRRLMNPTNGVYLSSDPRGYLDSPSLYAYAAQNPIDNIDPHGEIVPLILAVFVIGGALAGAGYSGYDAYHNPNRYEGWQGSARILGNVFGGAAVGGVAVVAGEAVLAAGGVGIFTTGTGATATSLTATQTFVLYGTAGATTGSIGRYGFNSMFPEHVDPVSARTIAFDYSVSGGGAVVIRGVGILASRATNPLIEGVRRVMFRNQPIPHTVGPLPPNVAGSTNPFTGNIVIRPGLSSHQFGETLMHEGLHRYLTPLNPGRLNDLRRAVRFHGYSNSHLLRYLEEGLAQSVGTGSFRAGFSWISNPATMQGYRGLNWLRIGAEGGVYVGGTGASMYGVYQWLYSDEESAPETSIGAEGERGAKK